MTVVLYWCSGMYVYEPPKNFFFPFYCRLDSILNGGIPLGYITEICGLARSGKTTFCTQLCINCLKDNNCNVLYIDTKGDFSAVKLQKLLQSRGYSHKVNFTKFKPLFIVLFN